MELIGILPYIVTIVGAILGSTGFTKIIEYKLKQREKKNGGSQLDRIENLISDIVKNQKEDHIAIVRMQLLNAIEFHPEAEDDILDLANEYFGVLGGNRQAVKQFKSWWDAHHNKDLTTNEYAYPDYFVKAYKEHTGKDVFD